MAIVTRYFSTSAAGAGDGTTWADRAALLSSGNWGGVVTNFDFSGSDSLKCMIGPGTYALGQTMETARFANPPTAANPILFHGCDSSGNPLSPPDPDWVSSQPPWDDSGLPVIATTANMYTSTLALAFWRLIKFTASGPDDYYITAGDLDWCSVSSSRSNSAAGGFACTGRNCLVSMTGSIYNGGIRLGAFAVVNCRATGVTGSSGNRSGVSVSNSTNGVLDRITVYGVGGAGVDATAGSASAFFDMNRCTIVGCGGDGVKLSSAASATAINRIAGCLITGNGGYGINAQSAARTLLHDTRLRDNTSGNLNGFGNWPIDMGVYTTDSDDATEYVNAAGGDFRIKNTATNVWGKGYGAGDEAAASGGGGASSFACVGP